MGGLGRGFSIPIALLFLCAGAAAAALITLGIDTSQALAATVAIGSFGVLSGAAAPPGRDRPAPSLSLVRSRHAVTTRI